MAMFKAVATDQLKLLFFIFVLGNAFDAVPANSSCGSDVYRRLLITQSCLHYEIPAAAMLLLAVRMLVNTAEASAVTAARAAAFARGEAFDADYEAAAAAARGIASVPAGWKRHCLRSLLLLAVNLSGFASTHAIVASFKDGFCYRTGCHDDGYTYSAVWTFVCILMCLMTAVHAYAAVVARYLN